MKGSCHLSLQSLFIFLFRFRGRGWTWLAWEGKRRGGKVFHRQNGSEPPNVNRWPKEKRWIGEGCLALQPPNPLSYQSRIPAPRGCTIHHSYLMTYSLSRMIFFWLFSYILPSPIKMTIFQCRKIIQSLTMQLQQLLFIDYFVDGFQRIYTHSFYEAGRASFIPFIDAANQTQKSKWKDQ